MENIEYDCLKQRFGTYREDLDEIVELLVETVCAKRKTTRIAGADFPHEVVRSRFPKLDSSHIEFVMVLKAGRFCLPGTAGRKESVMKRPLAYITAPWSKNPHENAASAARCMTPDIPPSALFCSCRCF